MLSVVSIRSASFGRTSAPRKILQSESLQEPVWSAGAFSREGV